MTRDSTQSSNSLRRSTLRVYRTASVPGDAEGLPTQCGAPLNVARRPGRLLDLIALFRTAKPALCPA